MIIDPAQFRWHDADWNGLRIEGQVIYEMHIGTFTAEGKWKAAGQQLKALKDLGVTVLEIMPVHDFCGRLDGATTALIFLPRPGFTAPPTIFVPLSTMPTGSVWVSSWTWFTIMPDQRETI